MQRQAPGNALGNGTHQESPIARVVRAAVQSDANVTSALMNDLQGVADWTAYAAGVAAFALPFLLPRAFDWRAPASAGAAYVVTEPPGLGDGFHGTHQFWAGDYTGRVQLKQAGELLTWVSVLGANAGAQLVRWRISAAARSAQQLSESLTPQGAAPSARARTLTKAAEHIGALLAAGGALGLAVGQLRGSHITLNSAYYLDDEQLLAASKQIANATAAFDQALPDSAILADLGSYVGIYGYVNQAVTLYGLESTPGFRRMMPGFGLCLAAGLLIRLTAQCQSIRLHNMLRKSRQSEEGPWIAETEAWPVTLANQVHGLFGRSYGGCLFATGVKVAIDAWQSIAFNANDPHVLSIAPSTNDGFYMFTGLALAAFGAHQLSASMQGDRRLVELDLQPLARVRESKRRTFERFTPIVAGTSLLVQTLQSMAATVRPSDGWLKAYGTTLGISGALFTAGLWNLIDAGSAYINGAPPPQTVSDAFAGTLCLQAASTGALCLGLGLEGSRDLLALFASGSGVDPLNAAFRGAADSLQILAAAYGIVVGIPGIVGGITAYRGARQGAAGTPPHEEI